ncbi:hypothetical protein BT93_H3171 [Corymbia citriodora subsp. variegata]|nr:hypothetical protein BT93_H3171 [Corymbia citriodora subsp. variegata]
MAAKLKVAGTWSGAIEVELDGWTVPMLREEVARRSNLSPDSINLICGGKVLKDGDGTAKLSELGVKGNAKILSTRVCVDQGKSLQEEAMTEDERSRRLARVKAAATALAKRHADGSLPLEDFNIELEDQIVMTNVLITERMSSKLLVKTASFVCHDQCSYKALK